MVNVFLKIVFAEVWVIRIAYYLLVLIVGQTLVNTVFAKNVMRETEIELVGARRKTLSRKRQMRET